MHKTALRICTEFLQQKYLSNWVWFVYN